jgi:glycerol transport system substrate-binding protein
MKLRYTALAAAMVLALSACGKKDEPAAQAPASTPAPAPAAAPAAATPAAAPAAPDAAAKWIDSEFQPSTLSKTQQAEELKWFVDAAAKLKAKGVSEISVVSETITTHEYESKTLAKAFTEITGIKVKHDLIQEGDVVEKIQTQMQSGRNIYDAWSNDSDLIGG